MKRRFLAMLLSLLMVFAMLPVSAFAADGDEDISLATDDTDVNNTTDTTPNGAGGDETEDSDGDISATAADPVLKVNFFADGAKGKAAKWGNDCERNTIRTVATGLDASENYVMTVTVSDGLHFNDDTDAFTPSKEEGTNATELVIGPAPTETTETVVGAGYMFSIKPWADRAINDYSVVADEGDDLSGDYTISLYKKKPDTARVGAEDYTSDKCEETPLKTATLTLTKATVDFGTGGDVTTSIYQEDTRGYDVTEGYYFDVSSDQTKATFYVDEADLTIETGKTARDTLLKLISFNKVSARAAEADNSRFPDGEGKKWVYSAANKTFSYVDAVTVETTANDNNISVAPEKALLEITNNSVTIEVQVAENYIPKAKDQSNADIKFTRTTAASGSAKATWTANVAKTAIPANNTITVSAAPAITVTAGTGVTLPDANVVTASDATTKVAMFEITPASGENTKATATITVTSDRQPVTVPADFGTFTKDTGTGAASNAWILVKEDATAAAITVNQEGEVTEIADLKATATRTPATTAGAKDKITLAVEDAEGEVETFKYLVSETEPTKPEVKDKATGYEDYTEAGFEYTDGEDYVAVATVNGSGEIIAWGYAVIPSAEATVNTTVTVDESTGKAEADVTTNEVDTALEKALQDEETEVTLDFNTSDSDSSKEIKSVEVGIPVESLDKIVDHNKKDGKDAPVSVAVNTPAGDVTANKAVLDAIAETDTKLTDTEADKVASTKVVLSIQKTVEEGDATTAKSEAFEIKFEKVVTFSDNTPDKRVEVEVKASVPVSVPTALTPTSGKLFTYFKNTANKLFYIAMANVTGGRASFVAPHLSTYVLYEKEDPTGGIGVNLITKKPDGGEDQDPILFDENREYTINLEEGKTSVTIGIPSTEVKVGTITNGTYDEETGVFALGTGKTRATMTFTKGTGDDAITYTLILKKADTTEEDDSNAPTDITIGGSAAGENVNFEPDPTDPTKKTATVEVSSEGTAISFKVASGATVTWTKADGSTGTVKRNSDGTLSATVNPGDRIEIVNSDGTTYIMDFTADGTPSTGSFTLDSRLVGLGGMPGKFREVTIENTKSDKVYLVEVFDDSYAGGDLNNFLTMNGNDGDVRFYLLSSVTQIKVWEVDESDILDASGNNIKIPLPANPKTETF